MILFIIFSLLSVLNESLIPCMGIRYQILWSANRSTSTRQTCGMYPSLVDMWLDDNFARSWLFFTIHWIILPIYLCNSETEPIWLCVGGISVLPLTDYRTYLIKYLNWGLFRVMQTLGGHGHFGGYDHLLFDRLKNLIDIKIMISDHRLCLIGPWVSEK